MRSVLAGLAGLCLAVVGVAQEQATWTQLSLGTCGVDEFLKAHPECDGRGVIIAVMDTGVDPSIPGLDKLADGSVKCIDVQDFTGDGDVELHRIRLEGASGKLVNFDDEGAPLEYSPPAVATREGGPERLWWFGTFTEKRFINADEPDLNGNGTTEDEFPVLVTALAGDGDDLAVAYVDTNLDRDFSDEKPLRNYRLNFDTFTFHRQRPETEIVPFTFALNIFLRTPKVVIHFDNGAHGTHVAGIAAGYRINNQPGLVGVAPGAHLMSLKIGHGGLGGMSVTESMKKAFEYAGRYAREHDVPIVCNLSFGVESEMEGESDIDEFIDQFLLENPYLVFCTSAGNSGPGYSSVGTPAAAAEAICVGALLAVDSARDVFGFSMSKPVVTVFSSRGGELAKPDVATPGWSTSTVPRWVRQRGDFWSGTSMASPYAAGLCANLISYARQQGAARVRACDVRRALWLSGRPVERFTALDLGYGIPDLPAAAEALAKLLPAAADDPVVGYKIATVSPLGPGGRARAAYWRSLYFPSDERQTFTISPIFAPGTDAAAHTAFVRKFTLRSQAPWCRVPQESFYLRSEQEARVFVEYAAAQLKQPGQYVGIVEALHDGVVAFRLVNTIIVPERCGEETNYTRSFEQRTVHGWVPDRYFLAVPPGASAMKLTLSAPEGQPSQASLERVFDPRGRQFRNRSRMLNTDEGRREVEAVFSRDLTPGVWEVPIVANRPDKDWPYTLAVRFFGLHADPPAITEGDKAKPKGELAVTNLFTKPLAATGDGQIEGYRLYKEDEFTGLKDSLSYTLNLDERFNRVRLSLEMTPEAYATTTDTGVKVENSAGKAIHSDAFDNRVYEATLDTQGEKTLMVVITGGFAVADDQRKTPITVRIDQLFKDPVSIAVKQGDESNITFYPGVPLQLSYEAAARLKDAPKDLRPVGFLRFRERTTNDEALRVPVDLGAK